MSNLFIAIKLLAAAIAGKLNQHFGLESEKGVTMIEYALLAALISVIAITTITTIGTSINTKLVDVKNAL